LVDDICLVSCWFAKKRCRKQVYSDPNGIYLSTPYFQVVPIRGFSFRLLVQHIPVLDSVRQLRGSGSCLRTLQNYAKRKTWARHSSPC